MITRLLVSCALLVAVAAAVTAQKSADAGVYTAAQAARGAALFGSQCASCHRDGGSAPNLAGERFTRTFSDSPLSTLFNTIKTTMPRMAPGSLSDAQYTDIVAHLLRLNGYPDGMNEIAVEDLESIRIPGQAGGTLEFALVQMVGCLSQTSRVWRLSNATEPSRTREPEVPKTMRLRTLTRCLLGRGRFGSSRSIPALPDGPVRKWRSKASSPRSGPRNGSASRRSVLWSPCVLRLLTPDWFII